MGSLTFIGLGLGRHSDISLHGRQVAAGCDKVFAEFYTSRLMGQDRGDLEKAIGREVTELSREEVENGELILAAARQVDVALLTAGDPMTATTHLDLRLRALEAGIDVSIIHSSSILTAAPGLLGLQHYKFGRTTTLPFPQENYRPTSPYEAIAENAKIGLHTLVLLDIDQEGERYMTANQGIGLLLDMEGELKQGVFTEDTIVCVVSQAGGERPGTYVGKAGEMREMDFGEPLHCMVVPGKMHFLEREALERLCGLEK